MRIAIGCDHRGLNLKKAIIELLSQTDHSYEDFGCYDSTSVDYPDIGAGLPRRWPVATLTTAS